MFKFYSTFDLTNPSVWRNFSYEDAHRMLHSLQEKEKGIDKEVIKEFVKDPMSITS
jgi:hypothetical protein